MEKYDVVIIGGGIAGLNIAQLLGKYKLKVCLVDAQKDILAMPFHTLGSFIDLDKFKLSRKCIASHIKECVFHSKHIKFKKTGNAYILDKTRVHKELLDKAVRNEVDIKTGTHVSSFTTGENGLIKFVTEKNGKRYCAKIFIDTSGTAGVISRKVGLLDKKLKVAKGLEYNVKYLGPEYQSHLFIGKHYNGGYGWIFPLGNERAILGFCSLNDKVNIQKGLDSMFTIPPIDRLVIKDRHKIHGGNIPITKVKTKFVYKNLVCIGDSVSQVNPLVGEGYRFILEAGQIAALYIFKALDSNNMQILKEYEKEWNSKFTKDYQRCKKIQTIANMASRNNLLSDILGLFLIIKRSTTFTRLISGRIKIKDLLLP